MKRIVTTLALLAVAAGSAFAAPILSESFTYPDGPLVPNGGWANYSGAGTDISLLGGRAVVNHANAPDDHLLFPAQATTATTYACFDVIVSQPTTSPKAVYFFELKDAGAANLVSRVYVLNAPGGFTFGISHSSTSATVGVTSWGPTLAYGTRYNVVVNYNPVAKTSKLWVNPSSELSTNVTDTNAAIAALAVSGVGLRQSATASTIPAAQAGFNGVDNVTLSVDNIGVGSTFGDACVQYQSTPTKRSTWGAVKNIYR